MRLYPRTSLCLRLLSPPSRPALMTSWKTIRRPALFRLKSTKRPASKASTVTPGVLKGSTVKSGSTVVQTTLPPPSPEQQVAINTLLHTNDNLIIDAIAGSGKTTTILHLAQAAPGTPFLVLVYNRRLMSETEERVGSLGLKNVTVLNYHTLGTRYYTHECATDQGLKRVVENDMPIIAGMNLPEFSVLVMDEQQDMTPILKRFMDKVIRDKGFIDNDRRPKHSKTPLRVVVLGDKRQELYSFNNADSRFLTMADRRQVFGYINDYRWVSATQTTSNRVTQQNVDFINQQMLKQPSGMEMRAVRHQSKNGIPFPKPRYVIGDPYEDVLDEVLRLLDTCDLSPADIIVLAPSVRGSSPVVHLANGLALRGFPVFRSDSDVSDIAPEVAHGKVLICTYHQAKGIERKASIVLGFDQDYHTWYNKVAEVPTTVSNPQYVAATRALEHLVLIHNYQSPALPFVDLETVKNTCDLFTARPLQIEPPSERVRMPNFNVTALCRNLSETLITECLRRLNFQMLAEPAFGVQPPSPTEINDKYDLLEGVSSITGTAVPAIFQWRQMRRINIASGPLKLLKPQKRVPKRRNQLRELPDMYFKKLELVEEAYEKGSLTTSDILYLSILDMAAKDGDITKILAIPLDRYNWFSEAHCNDIHFTLNSLPVPARITRGGIFFENIKYHKFDTITHGGGPTNPTKKSGIILTGAMDISRPGRMNKTVWEIKYTESLAPEHLLQTALYMLLLGESSSGFLVSARTGQTVRILPKTPDSLMEILQILVNAKSGGEQTRLLNTYSDEEFLDECGRDFDGLVGKCALPAWFAMRPTGSKFQKHKKSQGSRKKQ
ncbi:hypothetical protein VP1G_01013 [Cytospora mali]|uniref:Helicase ATP-binding domain-containing protein n=1 Tax=Cytospora mali TaxID=578113 RepID=A0A194UPA7_CYTMA|nr:hypothetical protein VP1G_01013 [Valsa mali var. pyri (nom. inval.)]